jgi:protein phosphatase
MTDSVATTEMNDEPAGAPTLPLHDKFNIEIPELCLVVLVGASGSGKSTFARQHFLPTEILSSDTCRAWVSDDELDQSATADAFDVLHYIAAKRLQRGKLAVVDATNVQQGARKILIDLAHSQNVLPVAVVCNVPERTCQDRNAGRTDRQVPPRVISRHAKELRKSLASISKEGFRYTFVLNQTQMNTMRIERTKLWSDKKDEHGPFDIIGDVHGCADELKELLAELGYAFDDDIVSYRHPLARKAIFLGDLADRGPNSVDVIDTVRRMFEAGSALAIPGNHDEKLIRWLKGRNVSTSNGLADTIVAIESLPPDAKQAWKNDTLDFLAGLISHFVLDDGKLVVAHAGIVEAMQGRASGTVRAFCLYGDATGERDDDGLPVRRDWAANYRGAATVVYGHTPQAETRWVNNTINIDTGCVYGGALSALRWPEREIVGVSAKRTYAEPSRPFLATPEDPIPVQALGISQYDLMISDVIEGSPIGTTNRTFGAGRRIETGLAGTVLIAPENAAAALELMSRFAVDPRWLVYLPPTMSPCETEPPGEPYLEHPNGAFGYFSRKGITNVICEEKHMGSRAILVICRDAATAERRFGITDSQNYGECYTRTGRRFFDNPTHSEFITKARLALTKAGFWEEYATDFAVIDCEILPWNAKAQRLLREQYAPVGAAATAALSEVRHLLSQAKDRGVNVPVDDIERREDAIESYVKSYQAYCWPVDGLNGIFVAPFHLLATEGCVHTGESHLWHLTTLTKIAQADPELFRTTDYILVDLSDDESVKNGIDWWLTKTDSSAEGMVVKPLEFMGIPETSSASQGSSVTLVQPAIKCRGREYLRIIYGPEYILPSNLEGLRSRGLSRKRSLARREFALGIEGLNRFVAGEPLHRVHECAFAVLALESEPIDPRL